MITSSVENTLSEFVRTMQLSDLPEPARDRLWVLLADMAAVGAAGRPAPASALAAGYARTVHPGDEAALLYDGSRAGVVGAAFANGVLANVLDFDDGHRLTKGHPGAVVIPAALAVAQRVQATAIELFEAIVVGYEIAIRAGIALHARDDSYHASGSWGAVGAAALTARLLGLDRSATVMALGLAEYHAPIGHIMRSCADPQMTKDACAWGASVGVGSALLAARGFTAVRGEFLEAELDDLGSRWRLQELYIKPYPCCRWSQPAIHAALVAAGRELAPGEVTEVLVRTFAAADGLATEPPTSTEEAQYSLVWPVAAALAHGRFGVTEVLGPFDDADVLAMAQRIRIVVDPELTAAFPARRLTAIEIELSSGERLTAGPLEAPGEPDDPRLPALVNAKVAASTEDVVAVGARDAGGLALAGLGSDELLGLLLAAGALSGHA